MNSGLPEACLLESPPTPAPPTSHPFLGRTRTSQQHLLQQVVDLGHAKELDELDLLDHLPGDAL